jgi:predicted ATPase
MSACSCSTGHEPRLVVLTGGPGAGKTAVLEMARRQFCDHVVVLPESATIVFGGGFPRLASLSARQAAQRAIAHVQRQLERMATDEHRAAVVLCDRGTVDGAAYWPGDPRSLWDDLGTSQHAEIGRYSAVIHLRTPSVVDGYNHSNRVRSESANEAAEIDARIAEAWSGHPRRTFVSSQKDFLEKAAAALELIDAEVPGCCSRRRAADKAGAAVGLA